MAINKGTLADLQDDLTLRLWEGDESAKGAILNAWGGRVLFAIRKRYSVSVDDAEDIVCEAMMRFWEWREEYDPNKAKVGTVLYKIATNVAAERISGRLAWQKAKLKEEKWDAKYFEKVQADEQDADAPDDVGPNPSPLQEALRKCWESLPALQQDILRAFSDAGAYVLEAATLGRELGAKHRGGTPIPGGDIRVYKKRGWDSLERCMKKKNHDISDLRSPSE